MTFKNQTYEKLKADARGVDQNEPLLISFLNQIYTDNKQLHVFFDSIKNAYVVDNTKLIELEEAAFQHRQLLRDVSRLVLTAETLAENVRNLKLSIAKEILSLKISQK